LAIVVAAGLAAWGGYAYVTRNIETTDDAHVEADVVTISPRVGGQVVRVAVADNQEVKKGELLVEIDPGPYQARLKQAEAELSIAQANVKVAGADVTISTASSEGGLTVAHAGVSNAEVSIEGADAQVAAAEAALERAGAQAREVEADLERARQLSDAGTITRVELEHREREAEVARARVREARAQLAVAREQVRAARARVSETKGRLRQSEPVAAQLERSKAQLELGRARVKSAEAAVELGRIDLDSTRVVAPASGSITRLATRPGQMVQPGQLLVYLVPQERYVVANFKETQVGRMKPGQEVDVEVDAYPGRKFKASIDSITAGTGSRFSLLPADNATGNFVKVVQRVPVRIVWSGKAPDALLEPGMSVIVKVHVH
jgi:membrane fusion protein (multidrug efflux system)